MARRHLYSAIVLVSVARAVSKRVALGIVSSWLAGRVASTCM